MKKAALSIAVALSALIMGVNGTAAHAATEQQTKKEPAAQTVTINPGDTLTAIATAKNSTVERVYSVNTKIEDPNMIYPGDALRIPAPSEQVAIRPMPAQAQPAPVAAQPAIEQAAPVAAPVSAPAACDEATQWVRADNGQCLDKPVAAAPAAPAPAPQAQATTVAAPAVSGGSVWDQLALCESGGNWAINTGNGFYGGLQFTLSSWQVTGGSGMPNNASREEQIMRAERLLAMQGWGAWPACTAKLGLR